MTETITFRSYGGRLRGPGVTVSKAPNADGCESPRCGEGRGLVRVDLAGYGSEVLCLSHADELLEQERGWS